MAVACDAGADRPFDLDIAPVAEPTCFVGGEIGGDRDSPGTLERLAAGPKPRRFPGMSLGMTIHAASKRAGEVRAIGDPVIFRRCVDTTDRRPPGSRKRLIIL